MATTQTPNGDSAMPAMTLFDWALECSRSLIDSLPKVHFCRFCGQDTEDNFGPYGRICGSCYATIIDQTYTLDTVKD